MPRARGQPHLLPAALNKQLPPMRAPLCPRPWDPQVRMKVQGFVLNLPGCPDPVAQSVVGPGQWGTVEPRAESFPRSRRPFPSLAIRGERSALLHPSRSPLPPASAPSVECGWVAGSVPLPFAVWSRVWEGRCASSGCGWRMDRWGPGGAGGWSQEEPRHPVGGRPLGLGGRRGAGGGDSACVWGRVGRRRHWLGCRLWG